MKACVFILLLGGILLALPIRAQVPFGKGKLYTLRPSSQPEKAIGFVSGNGSPVGLYEMNSGSSELIWSITELSDIVRLLNLPLNLAVHITGGG